MEKIKKLFATIFSTEFLKKVLLVVVIIFVISLIDDDGLRIQVDHRVLFNSGYGGIEIKIKE